LTDAVCGPDDGLAGVQAALDAARPGDTVTLRPGRYRGDTTLRVGEGVTLAGGPGVEIVWASNRPAVRVDRGRDVCIQGLTIDTDAETGDCPDRPGTPEVDPHDRGIILGIEAHGLVVEDCLLIGSRQNPAVGILLRRCDDTGVRRNQVSKCLVGIGLISSTGTVADNDCRGNDLSGIGLERDPDSPGAPSEAKIRGNRCHDNGLSGIVLGSAAGTVVDNDCWGNGSGIALQRDSDSPGAPSEAKIRGNRCHDNGRSGIVLFSSTGTVADNDCWGNDGSGIALQRDSDSPGAPSEAKIRGNRCHDNGQSGILLTSSTGTVVDNDCWGNDRNGIILQRAPDSPDAPSKAIIHGNRCHDNRRAGIALGSSAGTLADNHCWANAHNEPVAAADPAFGSLIAPEIQPTVLSHSTTEPPDEWARATAKRDEDRRARMVGGPVIARLRAETGEGADHDKDTERRFERLAAFVDDARCVGCFSRYWANSRDGRPVDQHLKKGRAEPEPNPTAARFRHYKLVPPDRSGTTAEDGAFPDFVGHTPSGSTDDAPLRAALSRLLAGIGHGGEPRAELIGLVSADDAPLDETIAFIKNLAENPFKVDDATWRRLIVEGDMPRRVRKHLESGTFFLGRPVVVDMSLREPNRLDRFLLEKEFVSQHGLFWERIREMVLGPGKWWLVGWMVLVVGSLAGAATLVGPDGTFGSPSTMVQFLLRESLIAFSVAVVFALGGLDLIVNANLPPALRFTLRLQTLKTWALSGVRGRKEEGRASDDTGSSAGGIGERSAWRRWVRHRVFGASDVSVLVLRNVDTWTAAECRDLREIVGLRRPDEGLLIIMHMADRVMFTPGFLTPWRTAGNEVTVERGTSGSGRATGDGVDTMTTTNGPQWHLESFHTASLILDDRTDHALFDVPAVGPSGTDWRNDLRRLFGVPVEKSEEFGDSVRTDDWSPFDLLPLAVIASTPSAAFRLCLPNPVSRFTAFEEAVAPFGAIFPRATPPERELAVRLFDQATGSDGAWVVKAERARELIGRAGARRRLIGTLRRLFDERPPETDEVSATVYLFRLLACGEVHHLARARALIGVASRPWRALFHVRAAAQLLDERLTLTSEMVATDPVLATLSEPTPVTDARQSLIESLRTSVLPTGPTSADGGHPDHRSVAVTVCAATVGMLARLASAGVPLQSDPTFSPSLDLRHLRDRLANGAKPKSPEAAFLSDVTAFADAVAGLDHAYAATLLDEKLRFDWADLPTAWKNGMRSVTAGAKPTLTDLFLAAPDTASLRRLIEKHAAVPATLALGISAAAVGTPEKPSASRSDTDLRVAVAHLVERIRAAAPAGPNDPVVPPLALPSPASVGGRDADATEVPHHASTAGRLALREMIRDPDAQNLIVEMVRKSRPLRRVPIEGVVLGAEAPIDHHLWRIREIDLRGTGRGEVAPLFGQVGRVGKL